MRCFNPCAADLQIEKVQLPQPLQGGEVREAGVGDFGVPNIETLQLLKAAEMFQRVVGNLRSREVQTL